MAEKYTLYLDESGDFDKDLEISWKNECLVGGLLVKGSLPLKEEKARQILISSWTKALPSDIALSSAQIFKKAKHATELKGAEKSSMVSFVLKETEKCGEFIIFENFHKTRIINSTLTYVNIMADGIIQLLGKLVSEHPDTKVKLDVIAGFRKDTTGPVSSGRLEGYIGKQECLERIRERLELAKVKNHAIYTSRADLSFRYDDDKANSCLILCDYICNFYLTRTAPVYQAVKGNTTIQEYLLHKYKPENIFSLYGNAEHERAIAYCNNQDYDSALYDICTGLIHLPDTIDMVMSAFLRIPEGARHNYLRILGTYFNNLIGGQRNLELGSRVMAQAELLSEKLKDAGAENLLFSLDIALYKLTLCSHLGQLERMDTLFETCRELLEKILIQTENLNYAFIYYNRYAMYLIDTFKIQEAFELLEQIKNQFSAYELILEGLPNLYLPESNLKSDQLGRILGTQVQCLCFLMAQNAYANANTYINVCTYENAIKISDQALQNLTLDSDKKRQYQYRAHIEAQARHYDAAMDNLCHGFDVTSWESFFTSPLLENSFALYHLSWFLRLFAEDPTRHSDIAKMLRKFRDHEKAFLKTDSYPAFITCANIAWTMHALFFDVSIIKRYYEKSIFVPDTADYSTLFRMLKLMIQTEYIAVLKHRNDPEEKAAIERLHGSYKSLKASNFPKSFHTLFEQLENACRENTESAFLSFANLRQY